MKVISVNQASSSGSGLAGYLTAPYAVLRELLGPPLTAVDDDGKVSTQWILKFEDGAVATLYDYKETCLYENGLPTIEEFRAKPFHRWHVGGRDQSAALRVAEWYAKAAPGHDPLGANPPVDSRTFTFSRQEYLWIKSVIATEIKVLRAATHGNVPNVALNVFSKINGGS